MAENWRKYIMPTLVLRYPSLFHLQYYTSELLFIGYSLNNNHPTELFMFYSASPFCLLFNNSYFALFNFIEACVASFPLQRVFLHSGRT